MYCPRATPNRPKTLTDLFCVCVLVLDWWERACACLCENMC